MGISLSIFRKMSQSPGKVSFLKHAIRIHAALCRPSMADKGYKKETLPGDYDRILFFVLNL